MEGSLLRIWRYRIWTRKSKGGFRCDIRSFGLVGHGFYMDEVYSSLKGLYL